MIAGENDWLRKKLIAHRGLHSDNSIVPENSLKAFQEAINADYAIELDVHLLSDNNIAVFHDDSLERICGKDVSIRSLNAEQIKSYNLLLSEEKIPLLQEVFDLVKGRVPILIEIRNQERKDEIQKVLYEAISLYEGNVAIQSFNPFLMKWFVKNAPAILRGQLSSSFKNENINFFQKIILQYFLLNFISKPHFIAYDIRNMPNKTIAKLRRKGLIVLCWTIKKNTVYEHLLPLFDNIIFEGLKPK